MEELKYREPTKEELAQGILFPNDEPDHELIWDPDDEDWSFFNDDDEYF